MASVGRVSGVCLPSKMALRKVKGNLERMFDKNLTDLVRGIRNNKESEVSVERLPAAAAA